jgi:hypothetical protein
VTKKENESAAVVIPAQHQSAPKEHWSAKELALAADEIMTGKFTAEPDKDELFNYGPTQQLAKHPRVQEALARLEREKTDASNSQEFVEKLQQQHELNEMAAQADKWDGQGRWIGADNEKMRYGEILSPLAFMQRLTKVIGYTRVTLGRFAVLSRVALLAPQPTENESRIITMESIAKARSKELYEGKAQVGTLQYPLGTEWMIMRFDEYGVPLEAKFLGWRTALLSMILCGVITEKEAHKAFPLGSGPAGDWYRKQLQLQRNSKGAVN